MESRKGLSLGVKWDKRHREIMRTRGLGLGLGPGLGSISLVPRPTLAPSQNGLAHEVEFLGFMGGAISLLIDYSRCETLYKGLLRSLH